MNALEQWDAIQKTLPQIKALFEKEIVDQATSLEERWKYWRSAPDILKNHHQWIVHFDCEKLLPQKEIFWYDDFYVEKCETVRMDNIVTDYIEYKGEYKKGWNEEILKAFKEEILAKNLGSFRLDW